MIEYLEYLRKIFITDKLIGLRISFNVVTQLAEVLIERQNSNQSKEIPKRLLTECHCANEKK